jgi:hypothetical protein
MWTSTIRLRARERSSIGGALLFLELRTNAEIVLDVSDTCDAFRDVLGVALLEAGGHGTGKAHLPVLHPDLDLRGIHMRILCEAVAHVLQDPLIGALVTPRTTATIVASAGSASAIIAVLGDSLIADGLGPVALVSTVEAIVVVIAAAEAGALLTTLEFPIAAIAL